MRFNKNISAKFRKDMVKCTKRGRNMEKLRVLMAKLANGERLDFNTHKPHKLKGTDPPETECHVESFSGDWVLAYRYEADEIYFLRTGTHADLFGN